MRIDVLTAALLGTAVTSAQPPAASAQADQSWQTCISVTTPPDGKVAACNAVIDGKRETGSELAAAYCFRGHGLTEKRQFDAALSDLDETIRLDPASACALTNRGRVYAFKRDLDRAMADYDEAIRIDPTFALAYNNRGDAWFNRGDLDRAIADFSAAIKHNPSLAIAFGNRGYAYHRQRDGPCGGGLHHGNQAQARGAGLYQPRQCLPRQRAARPCRGGIPRVIKLAPRTPGAGAIAA